MGDIKLRIDTRYFRMCIHRPALKAIGDPAFINFGYDPDTRNLAVVGTWENDSKSVRVRYDNSGSVYVFSKPLIEGIRLVSGILMKTGSYLVDGSVREADNSIIFPLGDAMVLSEG